MKRIMIDKEKCQGCLSCSLACMAEHNEKGKSIYDLDLEDIRNVSKNYIIQKQELNVSRKYSIQKREQKNYPIFCRHCEESECVIACMSGAMTKDSETGIVNYNKDKCAACCMCIMSCPYGVLKTDDETKKIIVKCDMCGGREVPRCVESCPTGAIYLV
jgi:carbon-monoxide dehydrogenase iron sulfur subunit